MIDEKKLIEEIEDRLGDWEDAAGEYRRIGDEEGVAIYERRAVELKVVLKKIQKQPKVGEWIPCSERLPEEEEPVLVQWEKYDRYLNITTTYLDVMWLDDAEEKVFETINGVPNGKVVAWQPLPEPWEGGKE